MQNNNKTVGEVGRGGGGRRRVAGGGHGGRGMGEWEEGGGGCRGRERINAINLQLITHQLTPGQLVASQRLGNMRNACGSCVCVCIAHTVPLH